MKRKGFARVPQGIPGQLSSVSNRIIVFVFRRAIDERVTVCTVVLHQHDCGLQSIGNKYKVNEFFYIDVMLSLEELHHI